MWSSLPIGHSSILGDEKFPYRGLPLLVQPYYKTGNIPMLTNPNQDHRPTGKVSQNDYRMPSPSSPVERGVNFRVGGRNSVSSLGIRGRARRLKVIKGQRVNEGHMLLLKKDDVCSPRLMKQPVS